MQNSPSPRSSQRRRDERGGAALELALILPVFVFILYALIAYGVALSTKHSVTGAASEGARAAVGAASYTDATTRATDRVKSVLGTSGYGTKYTVTIPANATTCGTHQCIEVTVTWDYAHYPVVPSAPGLGVVMPNSLSSKAVVQYT